MALCFDSFSIQRKQISAPGKMIFVNQLAQIQKIIK